MKKKSEFFQAPVNAGQKRAVLDKKNDTYSPVKDVNGTQAYYSYQGIGSLTGGTVRYLNGELQT